MSVLTGTGLDLVVFPFKAEISLPKIFSAFLTSSSVTGQFFDHVGSDHDFEITC